MTVTENEWFIQVPWGRICVLAWGSCLDPPVLLCHGAMDSAASFQPLVKLLPEKFYYIGMELPGNGKSDRFPPGLMITVYELVYAMDAVVRHFRWDTFALIAHSLGATIGKIYNISCPDKISKYVELDPINFVGVGPEHFPAWYQTFFTNFYENYGKYNAAKERAQKQTRAKALESLKRVRGISEEDAAATLDRWSEPTGDGLIRYTLDQRFRLICLPPFSPEHIKTLFLNLKTPTLDIVSKESYKKGLYRNTKFLLDESNYPNKNYRCIKLDGNHDVHVTSPELLAPYIGQFLLGNLDVLDAKAKL